MIRMIASDVDGTLLPVGQREISPEVIAVIEACLDAGLVFCLASGRQREGLERLFRPVASRCVLVCNVGAEAWLNGDCIARTPIPREMAIALATEIYARPDSEVNLAGADGKLYMCHKDWPAERRDVTQQDETNAVHLAHPREMPADILRVSAYCLGGGQRLEEEMGERWRAKGLQAAVGAPAWMDFSAADKAAGLASVCRALGIAPSEVAAFGDSWNDVPMLRFAGHPWLMAGAQKALRVQFPGRLCQSAADGMLSILGEGRAQ